MGYVGQDRALPRILAGLQALEYRGYDSAGIAVWVPGRPTTVKCCGRVAELAARLAEREPPLDGTCAIGHTRWATHGRALTRNAHPHTVGQVTLVHNGIIENEKAWRTRLLADGVSLHSDTDTEVAAALLDRLYRQERDPVRAIYAWQDVLCGSYAFAVLFADRPQQIYAIRRDSPLLLTAEEDGAYLSSDITALLPYSQRYYCLEEGMVARATPEGICLCHRTGKETVPPLQKTTVSLARTGRDGHTTFMEKEMREQPQALLACLNAYCKDGLPCYVAAALTEADLAAIQRLHIVACGSAMHAGMLGACFIEKRAGIPCEVFIASEYRYHMPPLVEGTVVLIISQSGETADSLAALRMARERGLPVLAIVNAPGSTIAREADHVIYTHAGPEIAVATTKGYCTQLAALLQLSLALAAAQGRMAENAVREHLRTLTEAVPHTLAAVMAQADKWRDHGRTFANAAHLFYIGRGRDQALALEGSLKLKEISYLHSEAYAAGELKHGTISLIEEGTPVIALATDPALAGKMASNVREVQSRGARVTVLCCEGSEHLFPETTTRLTLPAGQAEEATFAAMLVMQWFAYAVAQARGCDIDHPRNLAKSVTVE